MATPGFSTTIKLGGTPAVLTDEAMELVSGKTYKVTDTDKNVLDPATAVVVKDNGVTVGAANIEDINLLFGQVTFDAGYTVTGPVTVSGKYVPMLQIAEAVNCSHSASAEKHTTTVFTPGAVSAPETSIHGRRMLTGSIESLDPNKADIDAGLSSRIIADVVRGETPVLFEDADDVLRAWVQLYGSEVSSSVEALVRGSFTFEAVIIESETAGYEAGFDWGDL